MSYLKFVKPSTGDILEQIRVGDERFLESLYAQHRGKFIVWFQKNHNIEKDEAAEVYQRAFTIFYFNVKDGRVKTLNSEIGTYLFGIGKNLVRELSRSQKRMVPLEEVADHAEGESESQKKHEALHQKMLVDQALQRAGEPCRSVLLLYYFNNYSYDAIATSLGYKDGLVVKKKKCLCLQKIRQQLANEKNLL